MLDCVSQPVQLVPTCARTLHVPLHMIKRSFARVAVAVGAAKWFAFGSALTRLAGWFTEWCASHSGAPPDGGVGSQTCCPIVPAGWPPPYPGPSADGEGAVNS